MNYIKNMITEEKYKESLLIVNQYRKQMGLSEFSDGVKFVLYSAGTMEWRKQGVYNSKQEMIDFLVNDYGLDELKDCDENDINNIIYEYELKYEEI